MELSQATTVVIVDAHELSRRGLALVLASDPNIEVVAEVATLSEALTVVPTMRTDVVITDLGEADPARLAQCHELRRVSPHTRVAVLTDSEAGEDLHAAIAAGATGYLVRTLRITELIQGIVSVGKGQSIVSPVMATKLSAQFIDQQHNAGVVDQLTSREFQVLSLMAKGMSNRDIAAELVIAENTVKNHVRSVLDKLQANSRMEAVLWALREKIFDLS